jgi:hypothetical protein
MRLLARTTSPTGLAAAALCGIVLAFYHGLWWLGLVLHKPYSIGALPFFCVALEKALTGRYTWTIASAAIWATGFLNGDVQTGYSYGFIGVM